MCIGPCIIAIRLWYEHNDKPICFSISKYCTGLSVQRSITLAINRSTARADSISDVCR